MTRNGGPRHGGPDQRSHRPAPGPRRPACCPRPPERLDTRRELWPDEVRIRVERLNLDAASFRQLERKHGGDGDAVRAEVLEIVATRGKMQNPETGSGGMLVGTVEEVGPESPLGLAVGDRVATLVSLTLTPLVIEDGLTDGDGRGEQVPCRRVRRPVRPLHRRRPPRRPAHDLALCGDGRLRRARADRPRRGGVRRPVVAVGSAAAASPARSAWPRPGAPAPAHRRRRAPPGGGRPAAGCRARRRGRSSPTPATRSRCATPSTAPGDRPT